MHTSEIITSDHAQHQPRDRDEPVALNALKPTPQAEFIAHWEAEHRRAPASTAQLGVCQHCKNSLGTTEDDKVIPIGTFGFLPNICCQPCSIAAQDRWKVEERAAMDARFMGIIPATFLNWDDAKGNVKAKARAFTRFSFDSKKGLVLHGTTGSCKTFILWQLVRLIVEENEKRDADRQYSWAFYSSFELATKGIPAEAFKVSFLFIDDLGNEPKSQKFEMGILHLIRERCDWHRPILLSTQLTGKAFKEQFFNGAAGEAIMRRFNDRTEKVDTDNLSMAGMGSTVQQERQAA